MDLNDGKMDLCWGGFLENGWRSYHVREPLPSGTQTIDIVQEESFPGFYDLITA